MFEGLVEIGYQGAYDSIQRFVKQWKLDHRHSPSAQHAFVPLVFQPGEVCQFDWSQETVEINGVVQTIKVAQFRLAYSRKMFVVAYPRETQEMVMDAHNQAFAFYGGVPKQMVYDYVAGHIIIVMCPPSLCAQTAKDVDQRRVDHVLLAT